VIYRDELERCPRCGVELIQAGSARACNACRGLWMTQEMLVEMAANMQWPAQPVPLPCVPDATRQPLPCPACTSPMQTWTLHGVPIDRCDRHGIWFDRDELQQVLYATFDPARRRVDQ
jgi:Zn-finger nucleic acid-binding protein